jgi:dynein heavy chain
MFCNGVLLCDCDCKHCLLLLCNSAAYLCNIGCCFAGMVPALYDDAEKEGLISSIRTELSAKGLPDSKEACWAAYVEKCRANLHVMLAMSPVGEALRSRCRNFPGLVNNTVIDWFEPWPEQVG